MLARLLLPPGESPDPHSVGMAMIADFGVVTGDDPPLCPAAPSRRDVSIIPLLQFDPLSRICYTDTKIKRTQNPADPSETYSMASSHYI